ncbi:RDD family protein [Demequina muriae]|uniref:RDD family protein n=1 Tax=Demequina muriae TaxID=3051664 RepID=A0ABT8GHV3_9MICO|nr:RDD family protein [Demequina sp. EGI L300058]MDN4481016.1 RDD family protein [Demequina sp. EGI L300058]
MDEIDDEILTGEGVVLSTGAASVTMRMLSGIIDLTAYGIPALLAISAVERAVLPLNEALVRALLIIAAVVMLVIVPALVETLTRGRSPGRYAVGLRVVRDDGGPVSFRHAFTRSLVGLVELFGTLGMLAMTVSVLSARAKRLGDMLAGTYAMRVRGAKRALPPVEMPPHLAAWASTADIRRLPDGLALTCRMFLARANDLHVGSRARLATALSARLAEYVAPAPPVGTHQEYMIAAVLAERRSRETVIESRRAARAAGESVRVSTLPYDVPDAVN